MTLRKSSIVVIFLINLVTIVLSQNITLESPELSSPSLSSSSQWATITEPTAATTSDVLTETSNLVNEDPDDGTTIASASNQNNINRILGNDSTISTSTTIATTIMSTSKTINIAQNTTPSTIIDNGTKIPETCDGFKRLINQPIKGENSRLKKCCPLGQNYLYNTESLIDSDNQRVCRNAKSTFTPVIVNATFFDGCIQDEENIVELKYEIGTSCPRMKSLVYNKDNEDMLYVLQNGSLLVVAEDYSSYDIYNDYCLDQDDNGTLNGIVCHRELIDRLLDINLTKAQSYIYAILFLLSFPCLLTTAFFYLAVDKLRTLHGKSLACHSLCLAIGFGTLAITQLQEISSQTTAFVIQYFILSAFFWQFVMSGDICVNVWYHLPNNISLRGTLRGWLYFSVYASISHIVPIILVALAASNDFPGTVSYFMKGATADARASQMFFIPPISILLLLCLGFFIAAYYGFRELQEIASLAYIVKMKWLRYRDDEPPTSKICNREMEYIKESAKSTFVLYCIQSFCWVLEIISFYGYGGDFIILDFINALQGTIIFIIFICLPGKWRIIKQWWTDRGSLEVNDCRPNNGQTESVPLRSVNDKDYS